MKVSLIISTYNREDALKLVLESAIDQKTLPNEILIADDGSCDETAALIRRMREKSPIPILHCWQPDDGFRAAASRNNGIAASSGDYLLFVDGDCFLNPHFVQDHVSFAEKGWYVQGTRVNITPKRQQYIFATGNRSITCFSWGTSKKLNAIRFPLLAQFYKSRPGNATANLGVWRQDIERINGFDEWFQGHGGEDDELAIRLTNAGVIRKRMVHLGMVYHLSHPEHRHKGDWNVMGPRMGEAIRSKKTECEQGLNQRAKLGLYQLR